MGATAGICWKTVAWYGAWWKALEWENESVEDKSEFRVGISSVELLNKPELDWDSSLKNN